MMRQMIPLLTHLHIDLLLYDHLFSMDDEWRQHKCRVSCPTPPFPGLSVGTQLLPHLPHVRTVDMLLDEVLFLKDGLAIF